MLPKSFQNEVIRASRKSGRKIVNIFLDNYFSGKILNAPQNVAFQSTIFQKKVLNEVCKIPYGGTRSYTDIARAIGKPKAVRAVASAIAKNKLLIVIPCHRVIRSDGDIGKYRLGTKIKNQLLQFERGNLQNK